MATSKASEDYDGAEQPSDESASYFAPIGKRISSHSKGGSDEDHEFDRAELRRLASGFSLPRTRSGYAAGTPGTVERQASLTTVQTAHPALDPTSPDFDVYEWLRWFMAKEAKEGSHQMRPAGVTFKNVNVSGTSTQVRYQNTVLSTLIALFRWDKLFRKGPEKRILHNINGTVGKGELLLILGRPGSGCSTLLKTLSGRSKDLKSSSDSVIHFQGVPLDTIKKHYKGDVAYNEETDKHFPHLTVEQTLRFAATVRTPSIRYNGISRSQWAQELTNVILASYSLSRVRDTKVGNDWIRGISGGQRKRVSLAEMALSGSTLGCWDNSTRGLDSATALEFIKGLRLSADVSELSHAISIYQTSQAIYELFDRVLVLYEGHQVYFGPTSQAKAYFEGMGWHCPPRQTTADFLTAVTNPKERQAKDGQDSNVPRTPEAFAQYWEKSDAYRKCMDAIKDEEQEHPVGGPGLDLMSEAHRTHQSKHARPGSPYIISVARQIGACTARGYQRILNDKSSIIGGIVGEVALAFIVGSVYFGTPDATQGLFSKSSAIFFAILLNGLLAVNEINGLYEQRPIVEKQAGYAFYHPFTEALAHILLDIPIKFVAAVMFNIVIYFLAGLRHEASRFFIFFLFVFVVSQTMSMIFRTLAAATRTVSQALTLAGIMVLAISIYTGFTIPRPYMHPWFAWISYINPVFYAFEATLVNEVHNINFPCTVNIVPYPFPSGTSSFICSVVGAIPGQTSVLGDTWVGTSYGYSYSHLWRNLGILFAFLLAFMIAYLLATEFLASNASPSTGFLIFKRPGRKAQDAGSGKIANADAAEKSAVGNGDGGSVSQQLKEKDSKKDILMWKDLNYEVPIPGSKEPRRLLDGIAGWVAPGTLTCLMGASGAGKTTLLNVLAQRTTVGVVSGDILVSGAPLRPDFQRSTGYVQQQDLHLSTTSVREALRFSAALRLPRSTPLAEKYAFVEEVIDMLGMRAYSEAVVGDSDVGEGLNVEQRKMVSIGVELVAKPALLVFLDEPTSGLDSQSAWSIVTVLRKLASSGQAILATIHQPSAVLFEQFDRLLFLAPGGKTVYFGDIGNNSRMLLDYFESRGARHCTAEENPAEYILEVVERGSAKAVVPDWHVAWLESAEKENTDAELARMASEGAHSSSNQPAEKSVSEFAMPFGFQLWMVTIRVFQQYWRMPTYIWAKFILGTAASLFIGFTFFQSDNSTQGLQNVIFSFFLQLTILSVLVQQIMPRFVTQRTLFEAREKPSKMYSWLAFVLSNIFVELPYQILLAVVAFACYNYPIFGIQSSERQGLILLFLMQNFVFASTFAQMMVSAFPDAESAGNIATLFISLSLTFNGVMQPPTALPGFWIFMYRLSPFTYLVAGITSTALHGREVQCNQAEASRFDPLPGMTCGQYLSSYLEQAPGRLANPDATSDCHYCALSSADEFLAGNRVFWSERWRNFGIMFVYIIFNMAATVFLYWVFRAREKKRKTKSSGRKNIAPKNSERWVRTLVVRHADEDKKGREAKNDRIF